MAEIWDPTGDTRKGSGETVTETRRERTTRTARDSVADEVVTMVGEIEIKAEAEVREGGMATKPPPPPTHQDGQKTRDGSQNCREGGRSA